MCHPRSSTTSARSPTPATHINTNTCTKALMTVDSTVENFLFFAGSYVLAFYFMFHQEYHWKTHWRGTRKTFVVSACWMAGKNAASCVKAQSRMERRMQPGNKGDQQSAEMKKRRRAGKEESQEDRGGRDIFYCFFKIYKAIIEIKKLIILLSALWPTNGLKVNNRITVLSAIPLSHPSEKTNYEQSLCSGKK